LLLYQALTARKAVGALFSAARVRHFSVPGRRRPCWRPRDGSPTPAACGQRPTAASRSIRRGSRSGRLELPDTAPPERPRLAARVGRGAMPRPAVSPTSPGHGPRGGRRPRWCSEPQIRHRSLKVLCAVALGLEREGRARRADKPAGARVAASCRLRDGRQNRRFAKPPTSQSRPGITRDAGSSPETA